MIRYEGEKALAPEVVSEQSRERKNHVFKDGHCSIPDVAQVSALWVSSHHSPLESFLP